MRHLKMKHVLLIVKANVNVNEEINSCITEGKLYVKEVVYIHS